MTYIISFLVVLGVLILVHEMGHFLVARWCGVGVEKFSIGMGPRLVGKKIGITDYRISAIPFGGFVKMVGEEPHAKVPPSQIHLSFSNKSVFKRILIVGAGPVFNFLLAIMIFFGSYTISGIEDITPVVRNVEINGPAHKAGLRKNDTILAINDSKVESWYDIQKQIADSKGRALFVTVLRNDSVITPAVIPYLKTDKDVFGDHIEYYDIGISGFPELKAIVGEVSKDLPAWRAGIRAGDEIVSINNTPVETWKTMQEMISSCTGQNLQMSVNRQGEIFTLNITPESRTVKDLLGQDVQRYIIGISTQGIIIPDRDRIIKKLNPVQAFIESIHRTYLITELTLVGIVKTIQGTVSKDNLGGPIMIAKMAGDQATQGIDKLIQFIAFISISLAVLNLLPIPVLDGGHLFFFFIEALIRRPVALKIRVMAQQTGVLLLIMLTVFVCYNDIMRYF
jgi:regulator of sigma E protease